MYGFTESLNVSVATALVLQTLIAAYPSVRGDLDPNRAAELEAKWRAAVARAHGNRAGALQQQQQHGKQVQVRQQQQERQQQQQERQQHRQ